MYKLLNANFYKLKKDTTFLLFLFISVGIALITIFRYKFMSSLDTSLDRVLCEFIWIIGLFIAIFVSIFVGKEYSYGVIRNKIVTGCSRNNIYLSNLFISIIASIICVIAYILIAYFVGGLFFGELQMNSFQLILIISNTILIIIAYCTIFNFITMLCSEITISTIICTLLFISMFVICSGFSTTVNANKYIESIIINENGETIVEKMQNPNYPSEQKMKIAKIIYYTLPVGSAQEIQTASSAFDFLNSNITSNSLSTIKQSQNKNFSNLQSSLSYLIILIMVLNFVGIFIFNKKELK